MKNSKGFAVVEMLVVVIIIGLLAGGAWLYYQSTTDDMGRSDTPNPWNITQTPTPSPWDQTPQYTREGTVFSNVMLHNPEVIALTDGTYRMFFHEGNNLISAISTDGREFELEEGVRLQGSMPAFVQLGEQTWRLYYVDGPGAAINSAITRDGYTFEVEAGERLVPGPDVLDGGGVIHPSVTQLSDGSFVMFYDGVAVDTGNHQGPDAWTIMSARSEDGLTWIKDEGARLSLVTGDEDDEDEGLLEDLFGNEEEGAEGVSAAYSPHIEVVDGVYHVYFSGTHTAVDLSGIWHASSENGRDFDIDYVPVVAREPEWVGKESGEDLMGGPRGVPQDPFILHAAEGKRLFYWTPDGGIFSAWQEESSSSQ